MQLKSSLLITLTLLLCTAAAAQEQKPPTAAEPQGGIIYGNGHSFVLKAPDGWVIDNKSGAPHGLHAVFYPEGSSWLGAPAMMYANTAAKDERTLEAFIEGDLVAFRKHTPGVKMEDAEAPAISRGGKVVAKYFSHEESGFFEMVAYIEESKVFVMLVLRAKTRKDFDASLPVFKQLVGSYFFLTKSVILLKAKP